MLHSLTMHEIACTVSCFAFLLWAGLFAIFSHRSLILNERWDAFNKTDGVYSYVPLFFRLISAREICLYLGLENILEDLIWIWSFVLFDGKEHRHKGSTAQRIIHGGSF